MTSLLYQRKKGIEQKEDRFERGVLHIDFIFLSSKNTHIRCYHVAALQSKAGRRRNYEIMISLISLMKTIHSLLRVA